MNIGPEYAQYYVHTVSLWFGLLALWYNYMYICTRCLPIFLLVILTTCLQGWTRLVSSYGNALSMNLWCITRKHNVPCVCNVMCNWKFDKRSQSSDNSITQNRISYCSSSIIILSIFVFVIYESPSVLRCNYTSTEMFFWILREPNCYRIFGQRKVHDPFHSQY